MKRIFLFLSLVTLLGVPSAGAGTKSWDLTSPSVIHEAYLANKDAFKVGGDWIKFPAYKDRDGWDALLSPTQKKDFIAKGEKLLKYKWQTIPISTFTCFYTTGDKQEMRKIERANREAFIALMMAELAEGKGRFIMKIADGLWFYGTSFHWSHSNQTKKNLPRYVNEEVALGNVRLGVTVPVAWHFFKEEIDKIEPAICKTVEETVERIIIDPYLNKENDDPSVHWWLGHNGKKPNNWNPWCNHGVAFAALLMEKDQAKLDAVLDKTSYSVDSYFNSLTDDGCCDEGSDYWGQAIPRFCQYLKLLEDASGGKCTIRPNKKLSAIAAYKSRVTAGITPTGSNWFINFGDASPAGGGSSYLTWSVAEFTGSRELEDYMLYCCFSRKKGEFRAPLPKSDEGARALEFLLCYPEVNRRARELNARIQAGESAESLLAGLRKSVPADTYYKDVHQYIGRTSDGWIMGALYGAPGIQHGHNDVGNLILYAGNDPVLIDVGVATYTADTFGPNRFKLWSMRSDYHNCPAPNGTLQHQGYDYEAAPSAFSHSGKTATFSADIANSYERSGDVRKYIRSISLTDAPDTKVTITDTYVLGSRKGADLIYFITPGSVGTVPGGLLITSGGKHILVEFSSNLSASVEEVEIPEASLKRKWSNGLRRIVLSSSAEAPLSGEYKMTFRNQ